MKARRIGSGFALAALPALLLTWSLWAQLPGQRTFASPAEAASALELAVQNNDQATMLAILGPGSADLISSGDTQQDQNSRQNFVQAYQKMHRIGRDDLDRTTLFIGAENWPFPIPLVEANGKWYFDTAAGKREILYRRIGRNEDDAIQTCQELAAAEKEFFAKSGGQYAARFISSPGAHDGLFWQSTSGQQESPIGPLLAFASNETTAKAAGHGRVPFDGYYFRLLKSQGPNAPGGAKDYVVNGKMTGGFAFIAYPAEYRSSGVMTFMVGPDGVVYQKNLGPNTETAAQAITSFNPDSSWSKAE